MSTDQRRLNVNVNRQTEAALLEVAAELNISVTEALRVLVGMGVNAFRWNRDGFQLHIERNGAVERITWAGV